ncbi:retrovirus-related Pol polyprotein from transposon 297 [Trichonephila clavipes]|nr:retrovirus-related Pol polyprotein from transposon 297 [Trichonephila clavipes]
MSEYIGIVELIVRIREFEKPRLFHVLADLEYPCILGVDFISEPKIILNFDRKSLAIPDSQIDKVDKPGFTHVLYQEIDTGNNPPVVSRPYRYGRVKQAILDYRVDKKLKEGTIIPIQSPYASPVMLCRTNNGLPPDNPEAYRFAVDYRKLNAITKYPLYPLPLIDDLMININHTYSDNVSS